MAMPRKETPLKHCVHCGKQLERKRWKHGVLESLLHYGRRKYCDRICMAKAFDAREDRTDTLPCSARWHSRKLVPPGSCEVCGALDARDVHHMDGDVHNNVVENLMRICRSCHNSKHRKRKPCRICGKPQKGLLLCNKHYLRFKKYGNPLYTKYKMEEIQG